MVFVLDGNSAIDAQLGSDLGRRSRAVTNLIFLYQERPIFHQVLSYHLIQIPWLKSRRSKKSTARKQEYKHQKVHWFF